MKNHCLPLKGLAILACISMQLAFYSCKKETEPIRLPSTADATVSSASTLTRFWFDNAQNPLYLNDTLSLSINGNTVTGRIPYYSNLGALIPSFESSGTAVIVSDSVQTSGQTVQNFRKPVTYQVVAEDGSKTAYNVNLVNFTGLPVIKINTANNAAITSKETYVSGTASIDGAGQYDDLGESAMQIRGHGSTTWGMPKNSYRVKFGSKTAVLGEAKAKDWLLIANYFDKTQLRNATALYMGQLSNLDWSPHAHFAEVFINDVYSGTYLVTEKIEAGSNRVNIGDNGYLIEVDQLNRMTPDDVYFQTLALLCNIKAPDLKAGDAKYNYIKDFVSMTELVIYSDFFTDTTYGYNRYIDVNSFVDWYLINEITKNNDAVMYSSCYMNLKPGGKLKMGPIWDFDIAIGNVAYNNNQDYTGFYVKNAIWISRLFEDPAFVEKVKVRLAYFKSRENDILRFINSNASYLKWSVIENNNKYHTLYNYTWPNHAIWGSYDNEVIYMKDWLDKRLRWLENAFR